MRFADCLDFRKSADFDAIYNNNNSGESAKDITLGLGFMTVSMPIGSCNCDNNRFYDNVWNDDNHKKCDNDNDRK